MTLMNQSASRPAITLPLGTVTFLLTDVEGSTRRWEAEPSAMAEAQAQVDAIIDETVADHGGARPLEQGEGDSAVAAFARASDAAAAALELQQKTINHSWALEPPLRLRIALHTGEAEVTKDHIYFGNAINRSAMLRATAHGGQIVLSRAAADLAADSLPAGAGLIDLGRHRLRDLGRPEHVFQLSHPDLPEDFPPLHSLDATPTNLPVQLTSFVGRAAELVDVTACQRESRLLTLVGAGGSGKTRLALQAAGEVAAAYEGGTWWVELAPVSAAENVAAAIAQALHLRDDPARDIARDIAAHIGDSPTLLVIDNCEHVLRPAATIVSFLLSACPGLSVLATSREPLGVPGEIAWRVPSMAIPADGPMVTPETAGAAEAVQLFVERAQAARPDFRLTDENAGAVSRVCRRLDGIPLAIELAAARVRVLAPAQISAGLDDCFHLLAGGSLELPPRQQTLRASIEWSHDMLDEAERALLRRLSVFAGGFTLEAAKAVAGFGDVEGGAVLDVLTHLVDRSLVAAEIDEGAARYRLLETIRQFSADNLGQSGELRETRDRHVAWFWALATGAEAGLYGSDRLQSLDLHLAEADNYRAALEWALSGDNPDRALRLAIALQALWTNAGHVREGIGWLERVMAANGGDPVLRRMATYAWLDMLSSSSALTMLPRLVELIDNARDSGDSAVLARALYVLGRSMIWIDPERSRAIHEESISLARDSGDLWCEARSLELLVLASAMQERPAEGLGMLPRIADLLQRSDDAVLGFGMNWIVAMAQLRLGNLEAAGGIFEDLIGRAGEIGQPTAAGWNAASFYGVYLPLIGQFEQARLGLAQWLGELRAARVGSAVLVVHLRSAELAVAEGDSEAALTHAVRRVELSRQQGVVYPVALAQCAVGEARLAQGDLDAASAALRESLDSARAYGSHFAEADALAALAGVEVARGDLDAAETLAHEALAIRARDGYRSSLPDSLDQVGTLLVGLESAGPGIRLVAAAEATRRAMGTVRRPCDEAAVQHALDDARAGLGGRFVAAWSEGAALSLDDAVAYARRARGERKRPSSGWASLTPVETQVVALVAQGLTNPQVAERLFVATGTVKTHLSHVFNKLGLGSRTELAAAAYKRGLDRPESAS